MIENKNAGVFISIIWHSFLFVGAGRTSPTPDESCRRKTKLADMLVRTIMRRQQRRVSEHLLRRRNSRDAANFQIDVAITSGRDEEEEEDPGVTKKKKKIRA